MRCALKRFIDYDNFAQTARGILQPRLTVSRIMRIQPLVFTFLAPSAALSEIFRGRAGRVSILRKGLRKSLRSHDLYQWCIRKGFVKWLNRIKLRMLALTLSAPRVTASIPMPLRRKNVPVRSHRPKRLRTHKRRLDRTRLSFKDNRRKCSMNPSRLFRNSTRESSALRAR